MPIYEYECIPKGHRFEEMQKISDRPLRKCRVCGGKVKKLISATSFQLKGAGWYKDGYGSAKAEGGSKGSEKPSESAPAKAESAKSEKKSESTSTTKTKGA